MNLIKNQTPYLGKIYLKIEKHPDWVAGGYSDVLNKVHLDLGFTKIVSRIKPFRDKELGIMIDPLKAELINQYTDGELRTFESFDLIQKNGEYKRVHNESDIEEGDNIVSHITLTNSFMSLGGNI